MLAIAVGVVLWSTDLSPSKRLTLVGHTAEQSELVHELLGRFDAAGLDLPPLTITFYESLDDCGGVGGLHGPVGEITVCMPTRRMVAHEIAHAWEALNLTDAEREEYQRLWDAPTWGSHEFEWQDRAIELAANTVAFAVLNDDADPYDQIRSYLCTYETLTGFPLPTQLDEPC